ncbi:MAG: hypothetical protein AAFZ18_37895, partial [Myxococcota bacterium]
TPGMKADAHVIDALSKRSGLATAVRGGGRDLEPVRSSWCDLLEDVWETVPFTWISGAPVEIPPPASHRCRQP